MPWNPVNPETLRAPLTKTPLAQPVTGRTLRNDDGDDRSSAADALAEELYIGFEQGVAWCDCNGFVAYVVRHVCMGTWVSLIF